VDAFSTLASQNPSTMHSSKLRHTPNTGAYAAVIYAIPYSGKIWRSFQIGDLTV